MLQVEEPEKDAAVGIAATDYERLRVHLTRAIAHVCPRTWWVRREDFVQDCLVRVLELARRSEGKQLSATYLYRVAYSVLIDEIRRRRRRPEAPLEPDEAGPAAHHDDPEKAASARETGRAILDCLSRLARDRRHGVALYLQGHSITEAARILDWTAKRTENLVYRGLADLRACLCTKGVRP
jgi:RNA polymerase sigma-70 factor (ECF subfamily)